MTTTNEHHLASSEIESTGVAMFGLHVVALIDLLGQSTELAKWDSVPQSSPPPKEWLRAVNNTRGRVLMWREEFEKRFAEYLDTQRKCAEQFAPKGPPDVRRMFDEYSTTSIDHQHFSDTLIFYSPLQNNHGYWQIGNVAGMLVTCGALLLAALEAKTAFRGAIEVGMLTQFPPDSNGCPGNPYGPALAKAHHIESKVADYPRIVLGRQLMTYLEMTEKNLGTDPADEANRSLAEECRRYMTRDDDGQWVVDYLGNGFTEAAGDQAISNGLRDSAFGFVKGELDRFDREGNDKLKARYQKLAAYFRSRGAK